MFPCARIRNCTGISHVLHKTKHYKRVKQTLQTYESRNVNVVKRVQGLSERVLSGEQVRT